MSIKWKDYQADDVFDELIRPSGRARKSAQKMCRYLSKLTDEEIDERKTAADLAIKSMGITFTVYTEEDGSIDRAWPFDPIPRIIEKKEWIDIDAGLKQRVKALNHFIHDVYHKQSIVKDGILPAEILDDSKNFREQCIGVNPKFSVWAHICGSDLVRDKDGQMYVLEDNLRVPSGVSYMLENRHIMKRVFPDIFEDYHIQPVNEYDSQLQETLAALSPRKVSEPIIVVLTPGIYNSAYFEHSYLAQQIGAELVEGSDLIVDSDDCVYMKTIDGLTRVDVIYRRIDDDFLDPEVFNPDSVLGVPGLMTAWKKGKVALANAPGAGVADDKVIYAFVPKMIEYYLNEKPILPNVPTYVCLYKEDRDYVLDNIEKLVVKPANESGGYGMMIGPHANKTEREKFKHLIRRDPRNYIAQPMLSLSTTPTLIGNNVEPRHLDLRPFVLSANKTYVTTGGLTRVAMRKGSIVVNSSQGGGSKDTWVVDMEEN